MSTDTKEKAFQQDIIDYLESTGYVVRSTKDYHVKSQILWGGICIKGDIPNDTVLFRKFIDLIKFINGKIAKKDRDMLRKG